MYNNCSLDSRLVDWHLTEISARTGSGYRKYVSVTNMLLVLGLPSCDTIWHNAKVVFNSCVCAVDNRIVCVFF